MSATAIVAYPGDPSGAAFLVIRNTGDEADWLILAQTDAAARAELHTHIMDSEGVMRMREAEGGFALPAGEAIEMARGGDHVMLMGLGDISPGDTITIELTFVSGEALVVDVPVSLAAE